ncbi:MAG TPA: DNA-processing protein DprA [Chitinophagales bacterium]|nr:DNA-processing protein DprA [Chitinophagales bacterium]
MKDDLLYALALYQTVGVGTITALNLLEYFGNYESIFSAGITKLEKVKGIKKKVALEIFESRKIALKKAESELNFIENNNIQVLFYQDEEYPQRLRNCVDAPFLLFAKGNYDFNKSKMIAVVGTRHATEYGKKMTQQFVEELSAYDISIVSGLALGIDSIAHQSAVKYKMQNIAVLGHGLDMIYPATNKKLAEKIQENGALLTDFFSETIPNKQNFPRRNRIVAGMVDAVLVVESAKKGGALITAQIANSYNREVFCVPGNIGNPYSEGCNYFIKTNQAQLVTEAKDIIEFMNWDNANKLQNTIPKQLFVTLNDEESLIYEIIKTHKKIHIDDLLGKTPYNLSNLSNILLQLELQDVIKPIPGKFYTLQ